MPHRPERSASIGVPALVGLAVGVAGAGLLTSAYPGGVPPLAPTLALALGLTLGVGARWGWGGRAGGLALALGAAALAGLSRWPLAPLIPLQAALAALAGAGAGACLATAGRGAGAPRTLACAAAGGGLGISLAGALPLGIGGLVGVLGGAAAGWLSPRGRAEGRRARSALAATAWTGLVALRLGVTVALLALLGRFSLLADGLPLQLPSAALALAQGALLGLALGVGIAARRHPPRVVGVGLELAGWVGLAGLAAVAPSLLRWSPPLSLLAAGALAGLLAGLSLAPPLRAGGAWGLLVALSGIPLGGVGAEVALGAWPTPERLAVALGTPGGVTPSFAAASAAERVRLRFAASGVHVIDLLAGERDVRILSLEGSVEAVVPTHVEADAGGLVRPYLLAALPHLLSAEAPTRATTLGLECGIAGSALLGVPDFTVTAVEPRSALLAAHRDPGDLFGLLNGRLLSNPRHSVDPRPYVAALAEDRDRAVVLSLDAPLDGSLGALARSRADVVAWTAKALHPERLPGAPTFAFDAGEEGLVLVSGAGLVASLPQVAERMGAAPDLRGLLERVGLGSAEALLARLVASPAQLAPGPGGGNGWSARELASANAAGLPEAVEASPGEAGAHQLAGLAEQHALRRSPAALPFALAANRQARTPRTCRVLGDVFRQLRRDREAVVAWQQSLALDPAAVATRLSLAVYHEDGKRWAQGLTVLEPALGVAPERDAQVHYRLGRLAMGARDFPRAIRHLRAAGSFRDAQDMLLLAKELRGPAEAPPKLTPGQRLEAAAALVDRRRWDDAVASLLPLAHEAPRLSARHRLRLVQLMDRVIPSREAVSARLLWGLQAEVLAVDAGQPDLDVRRARALLGAGQAVEADELLGGLLTAPRGRVPEAYRVLGDVRLARERYAGAVEAYRRYLQLTPASSAHARVYLAIADAERRDGRPEDAVRTLRTAERLHPGHPRVRLNLGTLLWDRGAHDEARAAYRAWLEVAPLDHPMRERVEARLAP
jgi:tetratricopeptide (TPR) repeat protein